MISVVTVDNIDRFPAAIEAMHRDRKRVFVDWLKWPLPVTDSQLEIDQYDNDKAIYLIATEPGTGRHLGSVRLISSLDPHMLAEVFPHMCEEGVPIGPDIYEMTRFCASPDIRDKEENLRVRRMLALAVVEFGLLYGISRLTLTTHMSWFPQLLAIGWDIDMLGPVHMIDGVETAAIAINVSAAGLRVMRGRIGRSRPVLTYDLNPSYAEAA